MSLFRVSTNGHDTIMRRSLRITRNEFQDFAVQFRLRNDGGRRQIQFIQSETV